MAGALPQVSVVLPVYDEAECIGRVITEIDGVLRQLDREYEIVAVDDGSRDDTRQVLVGLRQSFPMLRVIALTPHAGQSAAFEAGFQAAGGGLIVTMDADGQNDPGDIPRLLAALATHDCCFGIRVGRRDTWSKRIGSRIGNGVRNRVLGESIVDTGCSLKAFRATRVRGLPMFAGMHRFLGSLLALRGASIAQIPVNHRPRTQGCGKYTNFGRLCVAIPDLLAVRWMKRRFRRYEATELA